jgi:2-dehydro-3-deoxyphosphogluconate aldolase/(4S)-4-hydroxy-2-oxoglutarate aldolase
MNVISQQIGDLGIIPVTALEDANQAVPLGQALLDGGLPCAELTFRTAAAAEAIYKMSQAYPEMLIGAGTVLTVAQAEEAVAAGAKFILAPGFDPEIVDWCLAHNVLVIPGVMTPTDIGLAVKKGLKLLKFFPAAAAGGIAALKAMSDPFVGVNFMPTGGINGRNLADFLQLPMVRACGGSWLVKRELINAGSFDEITQLTKEAVAIVRKVREEGS